MKLIVRDGGSCLFQDLSQTILPCSKLAMLVLQMTSSSLYCNYCHSTTKSMQLLSKHWIYLRFYARFLFICLHTMKAKPPPGVWRPAGQSTNQQSSTELDLLCPRTCTDLPRPKISQKFTPGWIQKMNHSFAGMETELKDWIKVLLSNQMSHIHMIRLLCCCWKVVLPNGASWCVPGLIHLFNCIQK